MFVLRGVTWHFGYAGVGVDQDQVNTHKQHVKEVKVMGVVEKELLVARADINHTLASVQALLARLEKTSSRPWQVGTEQLHARHQAAACPLARSRKCDS
jgi:hypothetical protein